MRLYVDIVTDGPVSPEAVASNVQTAIDSWRANVGLSGDDDEGCVVSATVTIPTPRAE